MTNLLPPSPSPVVSSSPTPTPAVGTLKCETNQAILNGICVNVGERCTTPEPSVTIIQNAIYFTSAAGKCEMWKCASDSMIGVPLAAPTKCVNPNDSCTDSNCNQSGCIYQLDGSCATPNTGNLD